MFRGKELLSASICAWRRAWLRHHLCPLFSFIFHALCISCLSLRPKASKHYSLFTFYNFNCYMNSTNVLIFGIPLSFLVTYFLLLTCCNAVLPMTLMWSRNRGNKAYLLRSNMWGCVAVVLFESLENVCTYVYQNANTLYLINKFKIYRFKQVHGALCKPNHHKMYRYWEMHVKILRII